MDPINPGPLSPDQFSMLLMGLLARLLEPVKETKESPILAKHIFVPPETRTEEGGKGEFQRAVRMLASLLPETAPLSSQSSTEKIPSRSLPSSSAPSAVPPASPPRFSLAQVREAVQVLTTLVSSNENKALVPAKLRPSLELLIRAVQGQTLDSSSEKNPPFIAHIATLNSKNTLSRPIPAPPSTAAPLSERHSVSSKPPQERAPISLERPAPSTSTRLQPPASHALLHTPTRPAHSPTPSSPLPQSSLPTPPPNTPITTPSLPRTTPSPHSTLSEPSRPLPPAPTPPLPSPPQVAPKSPIPIPTTPSPTAIGAGPFVISPLTPLSASKGKKKRFEESDPDPDDEQQER